MLLFNGLVFSLLSTYSSVENDVLHPSLVPIPIVWPRNANCTLAISVW